MVYLNFNVAADGRGYCYSQWPFLDVLILFIVWHTFLILNTSSQKYALKNGSTYLLPKFQNDPLILNVSYLIIHYKNLLMAIEYTMLQNLDLTVHVYNKLCRSASVYISYLHYLSVHQ